MKYTMFFTSTKTGKEMFTCNIRNEKELIDLIKDLIDNDKGVIRAIIGNFVKGDENDEEFMILASLCPFDRVKTGETVYYKELQ